MLYSCRRGHGLRFRTAQSRAARGRALRRAWRRRGVSHRAAAHHRRGGHGEDEHARTPGRAPGTGGRGSGAHPASHVHAPGGAGDDAPRAKDRRRGAGREGRCRREHWGSWARGRGEASVVGDVPLDRQPADPATFGKGGSRCELQRGRSRRCGRPDGRGAPRAGLLEVREALPAQGHLPRHLLTPCEHATAARRHARERFPVVRAMGAGADCAVSRVRGEKACQPGARLRRPAAVLARHGAERLARRGDERAVRPDPGGRISGHERAAGRDPPGAAAFGLGRDRGRGRCAVDLLISRRHSREHSRLPGAIRTNGQRGDLRRELPLDARRVGRRERFDRGGAAPVPQEPPGDPGRRRTAALCHCR